MSWEDFPRVPRKQPNHRLTCPKLGMLAATGKLRLVLPQSTMEAIGAEVGQRWKLRRGTGPDAGRLLFCPAKDGLRINPPKGRSVSSDWALKPAVWGIQPLKAGRRVEDVEVIRQAPGELVMRRPSWLVEHGSIQPPAPPTAEELRKAAQAEAYRDANTPEAKAARLEAIRAAKARQRAGKGVRT